MTGPSGHRLRSWRDAIHIHGTALNLGLRQRYAAMLASLRLNSSDVGTVVVVAAGLSVAVVTLPFGQSPAIGIGLALIEAGSLLWVRKAPVWAMAVAIAAGVALQALYPFTGSWGGATIAQARLSRLRPPRVSLWGLAAMIAVAPWNAISSSWASVAIAVGAACFAWGWGEVGRMREARRQHDMREAVADERRRIARELHDVVAHTVSVMVVQATAAEDRFDARPEQAREALQAISSSGRAALSELRRMLAVVRPDGEESAQAPPAGLESLDRLAGSLRAAGLAVSVREEGPDVRVPAGVDMSAYRIVQEALTNTLRHARASRADVIVRYGPEAVELEINDDGTTSSGQQSGGEGRGLLGMRERAALLGGTLEAGPDPSGGFRVWASLPLDGAR